MIRGNNQVYSNEHQDELTGINISPTRINTSQLDQDIIKLYRG